MTASHLYTAGKLNEAIDAQIQEVKSKPADMARRLFLFELLVYSGDLEKAQRQVDALKFDSLELETAAQSYRKLLEAEQKRRKVFESAVAPPLLAPATPGLELRLRALAELRAGHAEEASKLIAESDAATPEIKGEVNDAPFASLRDCDDLLGPMLEIMALGEYYWVPIEQIEYLEMNKPRYPRDLIWFPARLSLKDGPTGEVFLPAIYHGSHTATDDAIRLGRMTDWQAAEGGPTLGLGAKLLLFDEDAMSVLDLRQLTIQ